MGSGKRTMQQTEYGTPYVEEQARTVRWKTRLWARGDITNFDR